MTAAEQELASRLRRAQWLAGGLLGVMAGIFIATSFMLPTLPWLGYVWAFSEAALIGGLADWFAVTALFRRPLNLPIPHTAIVPTRKNEIGRALAQFVADHFLIREAVERRLTRIDLAKRLGTWLEQDRNAQLLSRDLGVALDWLLRSADSAELRTSLKTGFANLLERVSMAEALAVLIDVLTAGENTQALIDQLVQFGREQLEQNKATIRERIEQRSPWWMPKFVDEEIYDQLVSEFERILHEIGSDAEHPARKDFNARLDKFRTALVSDDRLIAKGERLRDEFLEHPAVRRFLYDLWEKTRSYLHDSFTDARSPIRSSIEQETRRVGRMLDEDESARERLNHWLLELFVYIVETYRGPLSEIISDTVAQWDAESTARRIELHIGKDLQFIRINGTLVGGFVGVLIYTSWRTLGLG
jgi:uncharacterized membrane-anchored protein YjiN (DUF445 family)